MAYGRCKKNWKTGLKKISKCHHKWLTKINAWFKIILQGLKATPKKKKITKFNQQMMVASEPLWIWSWCMFDVSFGKLFSI